MKKRDRDSLSQQLSCTEKRRSVAHFYNNKFSATLYLKTEKGGKKERLGINIKPLQEDSTVSSALEYKGRLHLLYLIVSFDRCCVHLLLVERASNTRKEHYAGSDALHDQNLLVFLQHSSCKYFN